MELKTHAKAAEDLRSLGACANEKEVSKLYMTRLACCKLYQTNI